MIRKKFALVTFNDTGTSQIVPSNYVCSKNEHNKYRPITDSTESFDNLVIFNDNKKPRLIKIKRFGDTREELLNFEGSKKRIGIKKRLTFSPILSSSERQKKAEQNNIGQQKILNKQKKKEIANQQKQRRTEKKEIAKKQKQLTAATIQVNQLSDAYFLEQLQSLPQDEAEVCGGQSSPVHLSLPQTPSRELHLQSQSEVCGGQSSPVHLSLPQTSSRELDLQSQSPKQDSRARSPGQLPERDSRAQSVKKDSPAEALEHESQALSLQQDSPSQSLEDGSPTQSVRQDTPTHSIEEDSPSQSLEHGSPNQSIDEDSPAESLEHGSPAQSTKEDSPAQSPQQDSPAQSIDQDSPAESLEHGSPAQSTEEDSPAQSLERDSQYASAERGSPSHSPRRSRSNIPSTSQSKNQDLQTQSPEQNPFKRSNSSKVSKTSHESDETSDDEDENAFVTRKLMRKDLVASGHYFMQKIVEELNKTDRRYPTAERRDLSPIENNMVEVLRGRFIDSTELMKAIDAPRMRMRGNHIMRGLWPAEVRKNLVAKKRRNQPQMREITAAEYHTIRKVCIKLQEKYRLKEKGRHEPNTKNIRKWAIDLLKNDRRKKDERAMEKQRQRAAQRRQQQKQQNAKKKQAAGQP